MKRSSLLVLMAIISLFASAQKPRPVKADAWKVTVGKDTLALQSHSPHEWFHKQFPNAASKPESYYDSLLQIRALAPKRREGCFLSKEVYGFHPTWMGSAYKSYDYKLLSTLSFFSATVDPATGNFSSTGGWETSAAIDSAQKHHVKVELSIANLGSTANKTLLPNSAACQNLITQTIKLVKQRNANGVNVDFEGVSSSNKAQLTAFITNLASQLRQEVPGASVSVCLYAVDWNKVFDIAALTPVVDRFVIMGYDYYVNGSSTAGPVAPLHSGSVWAPYNLASSVSYYLGAGVPKEKLILAIPYYGREWKVTGDNLPSANAGFVNTITYATYRSNPSAIGTRYWESNSATHYWDKTGTPCVQTWLDDTTSLGDKYEYINQQQLAGVGIFALGYDNGTHDLWDVLAHSFTTCVSDSMKQEVKDSIRDRERQERADAESGTSWWVYLLIGVGIVLVAVLVWKLLRK